MNAQNTARHRNILHDMSFDSGTITGCCTYFVNCKFKQPATRPPESATSHG